MRHTYDAGATVSTEKAAEGDERLVNLVGALLLAGGDLQRAAVESAAPGGASVPAALVALAGFAGGSSIDELSRILGLTHSGTVRLVDRLEAGELVRRTQADRALALTLTPAGHRAAGAIADARRESLRRILDPLDRSERLALAPLLERLLGGVTPNRAAARQTCRLCDAAACGHDDGRCPVTNAAARRPA